MSYIVARTYSGGRDLNLGVPDLKDAKIIDVNYRETNSDYETELVIECTKGFIHKIMIVQEK